MLPRRLATRLSLLALALALFVPGCSEAAEPTVESAPVAPEPVELPEPEGPRTVVLISLDTLRPDRLGVYGNTGGEFPVSPVIDALGEEAVVFDQALAPSPWTLPSHMTMLTGLDPIAHGVRNADYKLSSKVPTLASTLKADGFTTGAFTDGGYVVSTYGFAAGFDVFEDQRSPDGVNGFARLLPPALDWLEARTKDEDVFLFLHTFDAHAPFQVGDQEVIDRFRTRPTPDGPDDWGLQIVSYLHQQTKMGLGNYRRMSELLNDYDAGVFEADRGVGEVLDTLKAKGRYDDALIIITSDHGESFFDHELHVGHGLGLKDDELRVPLIVRYPRGHSGGTRRDELVGLVDIPRTVYDVTRIDAPVTTQGESLARLARGQKRKVDHLLGASQNMRSWYLIQNGYKYITPVAVRPIDIAIRHLGPWTPRCVKPDPEPHTYTIGPPGPDQVTLSYDVKGDPLGLLDVLPPAEQLFHRSTDPDEKVDLVETRSDILVKMRKLFDDHHGRSDALSLEFFDPDATADRDNAEMRALAMLGYLSTGSSEDLRDTPRQMREWVLKPWKAPGKELLIQADRRVQKVRGHMADGLRPTLEDKRALELAGAEYLQWLESHPHFRTRVEWRMVSLLEIANLEGFTLDTSSWSEKIPPNVWSSAVVQDATAPESAPEPVGAPVDPGSPEDTDEP